MRRQPKDRVHAPKFVGWMPMPSYIEITPSHPSRLIGLHTPPIFADARIAANFDAGPRQLEVAQRLDFQAVASTAAELAGRDVVVVCQREFTMIMEFGLDLGPLDRIATIVRSAVLISLSEHPICSLLPRPLAHVPWCPSAARGALLAIRQFPPVLPRCH